MKQYYLACMWFCMLLSACVSPNVAAQDTIPSGSYIINMGITPQTIGNGLKPYGLVYRLVKHYRVPVKWVINSSKTKDGIDFTHNGVQYRGGAFIIPFAFRTPEVNAEISAWEAQGVVGNTSVSTLVLDVAKTIHYAPNWTMDKENGMVIANYFTNAGIPASAYGGDSSVWKTPSLLNACDDIFVLPHADPAASVHSNLLAWNRDYKGNLWVACHAVSELENIVDPVSGQQLNFLTTGGMVSWKNHKFDASPPYQYQDHGNPIMQFMQTMDGATNIGSERTYLPKAGSNWRATTTLGVYDMSNTHIPSLSAGPAAIVAYGRAFGDDGRGWVMYQAGHDHNSAGSQAEQVAAQRAFFNYSFFVAVDRYATFDVPIQGLPEIILPNESYNLTFSAPDGIDLNNYTIQWSASCGGNFSLSANSQSVVFTPAAGQGNCIVSLTLTDGCGREVFSSEGSFVGGVLATNVTLQGRYEQSNGMAQLNWKDGNSEMVSHYEVLRADGDGEFKSVAIVFVRAGESKKYFSYTDKIKTGGTCKYRLRIHKISKSVSYSNMVSIVAGNAGAETVHVAGNPTVGPVRFTIRSQAGGHMMATLMDVNGRVMGSRKMQLQAGSVLVEMGDYLRYPGGTYLLRVVTNEQTVVRKIVLAKQ